MSGYGKIIKSPGNQGKFIANYLGQNVPMTREWIGIFGYAGMAENEYMMIE